MTRKENTVVVGCQLGDESKGRVTDYMANNARIVVRFQGGANSGHTVWVNGKKTVLHLVPSGVLNQHTISVIATGVTVDPFALYEEMNMLREQGVIITPDNFKIAANCPVITSIHKAIDVFEENLRGANKIGTTLKGIGPANVDRVARKGIKLYDLLHYDRLEKFFPLEVYQALTYKYALEDSHRAFIDKLYVIGKILKPYFADTSLFLDAECKKGAVLFEGAQSGMLDIDYGSYPNVTSSHCIAGYASVGTGVSSRYIDKIVGVAKVYTTRVGAGPFPTEITGDEGEALRQKGSEFGATTGRPRKVGWMDLVALKYGARVHGITSIAITKFDIFSGFDSIKVCTHYTIDGKNVYDMPVDHEDCSRAIPNYISFDGWSENLSQVDSAEKLPTQAIMYALYLADSLGVEIELIGVGPNREQTLVVSKKLLSDIINIRIIEMNK